LTIISYGCLLGAKCEKEKDYSIVSSLINNIPSEVEKIKLWTELGINSFISERLEVTKRIYEVNILPLIQGYTIKGWKLDKVLDSLTLVHIHNPDLAKEFINKHVLYSKEETYARIIEFYLTKKNPFESYDQNSNKHNSSYSDIMKAISLFSNINTDFILRDCIDSVSIVITRNSTNFSKPQLKDITERLKDVVEQKLPDLNNIKHDGYKIISNLLINLIAKEPIWDELIKKSYETPNISDKILIQSELLKNIPKSKISKETRIDLYKNIKTDLDFLESHFEYVDKVNIISETMMEVNKSDWKLVIQKAFSFSNDFEDNTDKYNSQRKMIDSIYRLDSEFAKSLIKLSDPENKDQKQKKMLEEHYKTLEVSKKITKK
jgi:hypothetical protein